MHGQYLNFAPQRIRTAWLCTISAKIIFSFFLIQVLVLLGTARSLSIACEALKIPAIAGEILAGVLLGHTLLGRLAPDLQVLLFPHKEAQLIMLETVSWLGVFFLLLSSGFHVDVGHAVRSGRAAILIGIMEVVFQLL